MSWYENMAKEFQVFPSTKLMTYKEHVWDGLGCNLQISRYGCAVFVHTLFPMLFQHSEEHLYNYLQRRNLYVQTRKPTGIFSPTQDADKHDQPPAE